LHVLPGLDFWSWDSLGSLSNWSISLLIISWLEIREGRRGIFILFKFSHLNQCPIRWKKQDSLLYILPFKKETRSRISKLNSVGGVHTNRSRR
jgi:hypothetical protein